MSRRGSAVLAALAALAGSCRVATRGDSGRQSDPRPNPGANAGANADPSGGAIAGRVVDRATGGGMSFVTIEVTGAGGREWTEVSDQDGGYRISGLPAGRYHVVASYAEIRAEYADITVFEDRLTPIRFWVDSRVAAEGAPSSRDFASATGVIEGTVLDKIAQRPVGGVLVSAMTPAMRDAQLTISDAGGRYRLPGLPPATYSVSVYYHLIDKGNIELRRSQIAVARGEKVTINLELDTRPVR